MRVVRLPGAEVLHPAAPTTWSVEEAGRAFATVALSSLVVLILAAGLLSHGTVAGAPWAHASGGLLLIAVAAAQVVVRRRVLAALKDHHLARGLSEAHACERARATLDAWLT